MRGIVLSAVLLAAAPAFGQFSASRVARFERAVEEADRLAEAAHDATEAYKAQPTELNRQRYVEACARADKAAITPEAVKALFGAPNGVELTTCGSAVMGGAGAWQCKVFWYGRTGFFFRQVGKKWVLNSYSFAHVR